MKQTNEEKPSVIRRVVDVVEWALLLIAIGLAAYVMINASQGKAVKLFGNSLLHIVTGSMEPTVSVGDYIYIKDVEISDLKQGDIIAYYSEDPEIAGKLVLHRIVNINEDGTYQTMGDANPIPDRLPVRADQIAGRFTGRARLFNWLASFVSPQKLLLLAVVIPLFFLSIYEVNTVAKIFVTSRKGDGEEASEEGEEDDEETESKGKKRETREEAIERVKREAIEAYLAEHKVEQEEPEVPVQAEAEEGVIPENESKTEDE